jgi:hypothetical protein
MTSMRLPKKASQLFAGLPRARAALYVFNDNIFLICRQGKLLTIPLARGMLGFGELAMSLTILLGGWITASVILSPLIGRLLAGVDHHQIKPGPIAENAGASSWARPRHAETMRRNVAIQLYRREAGTPRIS